MKKYKILICLLLCLALVALAGCSPKVEEVEIEATPVEEASKAAFLVRNPGPYLKGTANPLDIGGYQTDSEIPFSCVLVSGLKDAAYQEELNSQLVELGQSMIDDIQYDYSSLSEDDKAKLQSGKVEVLVDYTMSCDDYLSFTAQKTVTADDLNCVEMSAEVIDLREGSAITLDHLFAEGYDYAAVMDAAVVDLSEDLVKSFDGFTGVNAQSDFYLDKNGINLILDEGCGLKLSAPAPVTVCLGYDLFGENLMLQSGCDSKLYQSKEKSYSVLIPQTGVRLSKDENSFNLDLDNLLISESISYPAEMPAGAKAKVAELREQLSPDEETLALVSKTRRSDWILWNTVIQGSYIGSYTVLSCEHTQDLNSASWETTHYLYNFDADGQLLELADLFAEDFDYQACIQAKLETALTQGYADYQLPEGTTAESLMENIQFRIGYDALYIETASIQLMRDGVDLGSHPITVTLNYYDFNKGELTLF